MTKNFAHRGYRAKYPENTLLAFQKAIEVGCDGIELDIQRTSDGEIVIIHDEEVDRTTNGSGRVCDMTCAELKRLDAGQGERIPLLSEYFDLVKSLPVITNIELKNNIMPYEGMAEKAIAMVRAYALSGKVIFSSFNHASIKHTKKLAPDIRCGLLCSRELDARALRSSMNESGVEFVHPALRIVRDEVIESMRQHDIPISIWTVNSEAEMRWLIAAEVYGVFTDNPALLARLLRNPDTPLT